MNLINKRSYICLTIFAALIVLRCENRERFYRPDLPEQICAVGLVDIDDTLSYDICADICLPISTCCFSCWVDSIVSNKKIFFEKSYQNDYSDGSTDMFREFKFKISDKSEDIFVYNSDEPVRNPFIKIPANIKFESGRKYLVHASEKEAPDIMAECTVPDLPPIPSLVSLKTGIGILDLPKEGCYFYGYGDEMLPYEEGVYTYTRRFAEIEFTFKNADPESYYALFLIGSTGDGPRLDPGAGFGLYASNFLNYELLETNTDGFFYPFKGGVTIQHYCHEFEPIPSYSFTVSCMVDTLLNTYFIDGSKIPGGNCTMKIFTYWDNVQYIPSYIEYFQVRLMSMPKEAYLFYKSLYTYDIQADDPFSELVNINGNVIGGNGIIALCRSRELIVYTGQTGGMYDPYF
jgi:hypothetical protein